MQLFHSAVETNLKTEVFLLGRLGNFFKQVLKSLLSSVGDIVHYLHTQVSYPVPPTWKRNSKTTLCFKSAVYKIKRDLFAETEYSVQNYVFFRV